MCHKRGEDKFIYFYDTTNVKSVILTFEGEAEERRNVLYPVLVETKGPNPIEFENGYVAFEDLPDDWCCPVCGVGKEDFVPYED
jgi:rubredoxin